MPRLRATVVACCLLAAGALTACGDDEALSVADDRADQVRDAAHEAGLPDDVADVLAIAARGATATFQVTYAGSEGARIVVSQAPPNRRVDVVSAGEVVESRVLRDGTAYRCDLDDAGEELQCDRAAGSLDGPGTFTREALQDFTDQLAGLGDTLDLTVEERTIAEVEVTCLVTQPKAGSVIDPSGPGAETLCVSPEGAQLLVDAAGERLIAESYSTEVPDGTFEV